MLNTRQINSFRRILEKQRDHLTAEIKKGSKYPDLKAQDREDAASESEMFEEQVAQGKAFSQDLKYINQALVKLAKGKFGICEKCKKEITLERLKLVPSARWCVDCLPKHKLTR